MVLAGACATLSNGSDKVIVKSNSQEAQQYFGNNYILEKNTSGLLGGRTGGVSYFTELADIFPNSYISQANKCVVVNSSQTGLTFATCSSGGGGGGGSNWSTSTAGVLYPVDYATRRIVTGGNATTTNDYLQALNGFYANTAKIGVLAGYIKGTTGTLSATTTVPWADLINVPSYEPAFASGTSAQYRRGDKTWATLDKTAVGLGNVVNLDTSNPANITQSASYRFVTDTEKSTWNGKENVLSFSSPLSRNVNNISIPVASSTVNGYLSSSDWTTFNNKQNAGSYLTTTTWGGIGGTLANQTDLQAALNGKQPTGSYLTGNQTITLGGILSGSGATSITASAATGYYMPLTTDHSYWDAKVATTTTITAGSGLSGGGDLSANRTLTLNMVGGTCSAGSHIYTISATGTAMCSADTGSDGGITSVVGGTATSIDNTDPLNPMINVNYVAPLLVDGTNNLTMSIADTFTDGYLTSTDWNIFNAKQDILPLSNPGEMLYYNGGLLALSPTVDGQVLTLSGGLPTWQPATGGGGGSVTLPQDLWATSSPTFAGLTVDTLNGYCKATSGVISATTTLNWADVINAPSFLTTTITNPTASQIITYNGSSWVNGDISSIGSAAPTNLFLTNTISDISPYELWSPTPDTAAQSTDATTTSSGLGERYLSSYLTATTTPGTTLIPGGLWTFDTYSTVDSGVGTTRINAKIYKRSSGGVETLLFIATSTPISNTTVAENTWSTVQPDFNISSTDRIAVKYYAISTSAVARTVTIYYAGNTNASHVVTPLITKHNDLIGLQGGFDDQRYHLSLAQYNVVTSTSGTNTGNETTSSIGSLIHNASASTTPGDTDNFAMEVSSVLKNITWANIKATLKTYFDTIYQGINSVINLAFDLNTNGKNINFNSSLSVNATSTGDISTMYVADNSYGFGSLMYVNATGTLSIANGSVTSTMPSLFMALESGTGAGKRVLMRGIVRNDNWNFTGNIGKRVYVSTSTPGMPTTTLPIISAAQVQTVGQTIATNTIYFLPDSTVLQVK